MQARACRHDHGGSNRGNRAPAVRVVSLKWFGSQLYARVRVCDDDTGRIGLTIRHNKSRAVPYTRRYSVTLTARIRYVKVGQEEPIWANETFSFRDEYDVGSDPTAFFDQSGQAIERLSTSFARSLVAAMLEAF